MKRGLVFGDMFIPQREGSIPEEFNQYFEKGVYDFIATTGNITSKSLAASLKTLAKQVCMVEGGYDEDKCSEAEDTITVGGLRIHVTSASDMNEVKAEQLRSNSDIVVHKNGDHSPTAFQKDDRIFLSPGSATGAFSLSTPSAVPSFMILDIEGFAATIYKYTLEDGEVAVTHKKFTILNPSNPEGDDN
eukprot:TRINITY_DN2061_c4_g1_i1.p2 TRINITY_DN2061_c4_g1~~TRINITY_DN2061_c4_g1_i1.p2  ORF type:complete len:209 (+),score=54.22 TRINITY_DN2061_c4_g1_i1:63-629(+)